MWAKLALQSSFGSGGGISAIFILQVVDEGGNRRQLGGQVQAVFQHRHPTAHPCACLRHTFRVKIDSVCIARMAWENRVIGWVWRGMAAATSKTYCGTWLRAFHSFSTSRASSSGGDFAHQQQVIQAAYAGASRRPGVLGSFSSTSGMVKPRRRMPSFGIDIRNIGHQALDIAHTAVNLADGDLVNLYFAALRPAIS